MFNNSTQLVQIFLFNSDIDLIKCYVRQSDFVKKAINQKNYIPDLMLK